MAKLSDARRSLQRARESAQERLNQLEDERRELKSSMKSLAAALKALGDPESSAKPRTSSVTSFRVVDTDREANDPPPTSDT